MWESEGIFVGTVLSNCSSILGFGAKHILAVDFLGCVCAVIVVSEQLESEMTAAVRKVSDLFVCGLMLPGRVRSESAGCCCFASHYQVLAACTLLEFKGSCPRGERISYKFG